MVITKKDLYGDRTDNAPGSALYDREVRQKTYRERALKIFPWVCGKCGREFSGKKIRELTVHHKDHNHENNPPDGSNWELLCLYCHDNEHSRFLDAEWCATPSPGSKDGPVATHTPFSALKDMLTKNE
ncbi:MAG: YajD family HNH nuclease [Proteobacteria bacterium]|nr:YajD family HNH nuclease [Pseudomonadota bacterium]MBU1233970.1 YajD family HNH nuclease [Pseudomonadota bacterium]MBU1419675.1 YajD family HNH nuclease [Pseudomonadota bacterium]MBU1454131.1 YajD family HNH nuclease [Pseudomonadota bacterium]